MLNINILFIFSFILFSVELSGQNSNRSLYYLLQNEGVQIAGMNELSLIVAEIGKHDTLEKWIVFSDSTCSSKILYSRELKLFFVARLCGGESHGEFCYFEVIDLSGFRIAIWKFKSNNQTFHSFTFFYPDRPEKMAKIMMRDGYERNRKHLRSWGCSKKIKEYAFKETIELDEDEFLKLASVILRIRKRTRPKLSTTSNSMIYCFCYE